MPWVVDDAYSVGGSLATGDSGRLSNPNFPSEVGATESWTGSIDAVNAGESRDTFRARINGEIRPSFDLEPGESGTIGVSGTGPSTFTIFLERSVVEVPLYKKYAKELAIVSVAGLVGLVIMAKR